MINNDILNTQIDLLYKEIDQTNNKTKLLSQDKIIIQAEIENTEQRIEILNSKIRDLKAHGQKINELYTRTWKSVESAKEYEKEIVEKLARHIKLENDIAEDLLKYRGIVAESRSSYQKFEVKRIWLVMVTDATIVLQKDSDGKHILKISDGEKLDQYKIAEIDSIFMHPTKQDRFFLRANEEGDQEYESESAIKIMELIRELIFSDRMRENSD